MRIVAGQFKGRAIQAPASQATRPTTDRARETLFNMLMHAEWAPELKSARVLDLYAGSGALGLEALSRGAGFCLFVETAAPARGAIRGNIEALGLFGATRLHRRSATDLGPKPSNLGEAFDLIFMDPPYGKDLIEPTLKGLTTGGWLTKDALIIAETGLLETIELTGWTLLKTKEIASSKFWFLKQDAES